MNKVDMAMRQEYIDARKAHRAKLAARAAGKPVKNAPATDRLSRQLEAIAGFRRSKRFIPEMAAALDERERFLRGL